jgi:hypothetical protein
MNKLLAAALIISLSFALMGNTGCVTPTSDSIQEAQTEQSLKEAHAQVGMPTVTNFTQRKLAKRVIEELDREDLPTYVYLVNMQGELIFLTRAIGYGLPYSTQFTNPEKTELHFGESVNLPQAEPNGLFMPESASATWIFAVGEDGETYPMYVESEITVSPFPILSAKNNP